MTYECKYLTGNSIGSSNVADNIILLSKDIEVLPCNLANIAQVTGLSFHTKKRLQDKHVWDKSVELIKDELDKIKTNNKVLILNKMNYNLSHDIGATNYLATFYNRTYLDLAGLITEQYDLEPFNENFSIRKFDLDVNDHVADDEIIYFYDSDNIVETVIDVLREKYDEFKKVPQDEMWDRVYNEPWFIIKTLLVDECIEPWKYLGKNYTKIFTKLVSEIDIFMEKAEQKITKSKNTEGMVLFDLGMLYLKEGDDALDSYRLLCNDLGITPNIDAFVDFYQDNRMYMDKGIGAEPIDNKYNDIFYSIAKYLLKVDSVYADTTLKSLRWNLGCQVAFGAAIKQFDEKIDLDFAECNTIQDLIDKII